MDKTDEGNNPPQAEQGEPCCSRCEKPKSQVKLWIEKHHQCSICVATATKYAKAGKPCPPYIGRSRKHAHRAAQPPLTPPQDERKASEPQDIISALTRSEDFILALQNSPMLYALFKAAHANGDTKDAFLEKAVLALNEQLKKQQDELIKQAMNATPESFVDIEIPFTGHPSLVFCQTEYKSLVNVFAAAYEQAAEGKGKERHAVENQPFELQTMCEITRRLKDSPIAGVLYQAVKKCYESPRLSFEKARVELLGAIDYLAAGVILLDELIAAEPKKKITVSIRAENLFSSGAEKIAEELNKAFKLADVQPHEEPTL